MSKLAPGNLSSNGELLLFDAILDRAQLDLPPWYLRSAEGALIAGESILRAACYRPGSYRPHSWIKKDRHAYHRYSHDRERRLWVRRCGDFWVIERVQIYTPSSPIDEALVCAFFRSPIWAHNCQAAMRVADYCDPLPQPPVAGRWVDVLS